MHTQIPRRPISYAELKLIAFLVAVAVLCLATAFV